MPHSCETQPATVEFDGYTFPPFDLRRLLTTVFDLEGGERVGIFTDLDDPRSLADADFIVGLAPDSEQHHAIHTVYQPLVEGWETGWTPADVELFSYEAVGGSNLELPDTVWTQQADERNLTEVLAELDIVLYIGTWSATAPITALSKQIGFRGATMHGLNDRVLASGLSVDYEVVSAEAEKLRLAMTRADKMTVTWVVEGEELSLDVLLDQQEAQKSHGLVRTMGDVANLPAGEVYFVPTGGEGLMPQQLEDEAGTVVIWSVSGGRLVSAQRVVSGDATTVDAMLKVFEEDPAAARITELGLGTQSLPWAGTDIQDEKIIGTAHLATGRSDHLGGDVGPSAFNNIQNAAHNDILYTPEKTQSVELKRVTMTRDGKEQLVLEDYQPAELLRKALES